MIKTGLVLAIILLPSLIPAASLTVEWDANDEDDLAGYRVYWGRHSKQYNGFAHVGKQLSCQIDGLNKDTQYYIAVSAVDLWGNESDHSREVVAIPGIGTVENQAPVVLRLKNNYPNPFNPTTTIEFDVPEKLAITIAVFNNLGQKISTLEDGVFEPDTYFTVWDGTDESENPVAAGVYFCRLESPLKTCVQVMTLLR